MLEQHSATGATARSPSSSGSPTRPTRRVRCAAPGGRRPRGARRPDRAGATRSLPAGSARPLRRTSISTLDLAQAKGHTDDAPARARPSGRARRPTSPARAAIQHDLDPIFTSDLQKGEAIALPIALLVLLAVFGLSLAVTIPFLFAACTIIGTLGIVYVVAHYMTMPTYVTNLVFLIGLGIAIDYSLLIVYRFREELGARPRGRRGGRADDGDRRPRGRSSPARRSRSGSRCCSSCRCRSCARWASAAS